MALNGAFWTQKNYGVQISSKKWNPFVTDEFPYETVLKGARGAPALELVPNKMPL